MYPVPMTGEPKTYILYSARFLNFYICDTPLITKFSDRTTKQNGTNMNRIYNKLVFEWYTKGKDMGQKNVICFL
jgi:hypothetical protein